MSTYLYNNTCFINNPRARNTGECRTKEETDNKISYFRHSLGVNTVCMYIISGCQANEIFHKLIILLKRRVLSIMR